MGFSELNINFCNTFIRVFFTLIQLIPTALIPSRLSLFWLYRIWRNERTFYEQFFLIFFAVEHLINEQ